MALGTHLSGCVQHMGGKIHVWGKLKQLIRSAVFNQRFLKLAGWYISRCRLGKASFSMFENYGLFVFRKSYYLPIPDQQDIACVQDSELVGVTVDFDAVFKFVNETVVPYLPELNKFPLVKSSDSTSFYLLNGSFMSVDASVYYAMIRHFAPRRIIEIGAGNSTLLAAAAIQTNLLQNLCETELISIDPYPSMNFAAIPEVSRFIEAKVQEVDLDLFTSLAAGDILFIDSSHTVKLGGDVWWEICEILPRLHRGVLVHIHDISLPKPYPKIYYDSQLLWMEQYLLQAFLIYNSYYEIIWPDNLIATKYPEQIQQIFSPGYQHMVEAFPNSEPTSFWMRVNT